jgi:PD-(D/E)XK nuclease superfamily protein
MPKTASSGRRDLLLPGNRVQAESLLDEAKRSIWSLIEHLRAASVVRTTVNVSPDPVLFVGGNLCGFIDLLAENNTSRKAVIDLKYNGYAEKIGELANNLQLQLAVYGRLVANGTVWRNRHFLSGKDALCSRRMAGFS